jgi:hypothetical protein
MVVAVVWATPGDSLWAGAGRWRFPSWLSANSALVYSSLESSSRRGVVELQWQCDTWNMSL